jgi:hypothetical protein
MSATARLRSLSIKEQALVALAVLIDGHDAVEFLGSDKERATALSRAAKDLADVPPETRLPLAGTLLREALAELESA